MIFFFCIILQYSQKSLSIDKKSIPSHNINLGKESNIQQSKKNCDNSGTTSSIPRRISNVAKPSGEDLIDLENGGEDTLDLFIHFCFAKYLKPQFYFIFFFVFRSRVSVLEAFDPLLMNEYGDNGDQGK